MKMESIAIGDIFVCSWGYDQTNIDFYQVIKRTAKTVSVRKIREKHEPAYSMANYIMPIKDSFLDGNTRFEEEYGKPITRRLRTFKDGRIYFKPASYSLAKLWDGTKQTETYIG